MLRQCSHHKRKNNDITESVDDRTKCIVFGFVRSVELYIPSEIVLMCLLYYYNGEYFTVYGSEMTLKDNGDTIEGSQNLFVENTAYGKKEINKNDYIKCIWDFEIKKCNSTYNTMVIGIAINKRSIEEWFIVMAPSEVMEDESNVFCGYNYGYCTRSANQGDILNVNHLRRLTSQHAVQTKVMLNKNDNSTLNFERKKPYGCVWEVG
eukprot:362068_1